MNVVPNVNGVSDYLDMHHENLKPLAKGRAIFPASGPKPGPYLLYLAGSAVNFEQVQRLVETVPHYQLGPFCWIVLPPTERIREFADELSMALPGENDEAEALLCHLSRSAIFHRNRGGLGLIEWLKKIGYLP